MGIVRGMTVRTVVQRGPKEKKAAVFAVDCGLEPRR